MSPSFLMLLRLIEFRDELWQSAYAWVSVPVASPDHDKVSASSGKALGVGLGLVTAGVGLLVAVLPAPAQPPSWAIVIDNVGALRRRIHRLITSVSPYSRRRAVHLLSAGLNAIAAVAGYAPDAGTQGRNCGVSVTECPAPVETSGVE
jgi:hypothetical protein